MVTAAPGHVPEPLVEQLNLGGRWVLSVGDDSQQLLQLNRTEGGVRIDTLYQCVSCDDGPSIGAGSIPAIRAGTAAGNAGKFPGCYPLLVVVDDQFGIFLAADVEPG